MTYYNYTRLQGALSHKPAGSRLTTAPRNNRAACRGRWRSRLDDLGFGLRDRLVAEAAHLSEEALTSSSGGSGGSAASNAIRSDIRAVGVGV
jgi:hypothetical protein